MARARQTEIKGMEVKKFADVENAADAYVEARDGRMDLLKQEIELKAAVIAAMAAHGVKAYDRGEYHVTLENVEKCKVKIGAEEPKEE
jgi:hypothetical protein